MTIAGGLMSKCNSHFLMFCSLELHFVWKLPGLCTQYLIDIKSKLLVIQSHENDNLNPNAHILNPHTLLNLYQASWFVKG